VLWLRIAWAQLGRKYGGKIFVEVFLSLRIGLIFRSRTLLLLRKLKRTSRRKLK
jgi:hypothetical protein